MDSSEHFRIVCSTVKLRLVNRWVLVIQDNRLDPCINHQQQLNSINISLTSAMIQLRPTNHRHWTKSEHCKWKRKERRNKIWLEHFIQVFFFSCRKLFTIENVVQHQRVIRHIKPAVMPAQLQFQANVSIRIDPLSTSNGKKRKRNEKSQKSIFQSIKLFFFNAFLWLTDKNDVIVTCIRGLRMSAAAFFAVVTFPCTIFSDRMSWESAVWLDAGWSKMSANSTSWGRILLDNVLSNICVWFRTDEMILSTFRPAVKTSNKPLCKSSLP